LPALKQEILSQLPQVDRLLQHSRVKQLDHKFPRQLIVDVIREELQTIRTQIQQLENEELASLHLDAEDILNRVCKAIEIELKPRMRRAVNASGIILHTGLGRAPMSSAAKEAVIEVAEGFSPLEIDLESGGRGDRYKIVEDLLIKLTGAEAALVVNNNAAAVLLALNTLAFQKEILISRGELIAIGGSFRIPDIIEKSNARMMEVGTTNQTCLKDFQNAINEQTAVILRVHTSNYKIIGYTGNVSLAELIQLGQENNLPVVDDLGSGMLIDLSRYGLPKEPVVAESIKTGADVVTFSGDKLLGGPQAGIIVGRKKYIDAIKVNQLARTLRCCKLTYAALEATLRLFFDEGRLLETHSVLKCLTTPIKKIVDRADELCIKLKNISEEKNDIGIIDGLSEVGGGSLATESLPSKLVYIQLGEMPAQELARYLRMNDPPIIPRVHNDQLVIDARTINDTDIDIIVNAVANSYI